jgi:hypothetical protein
MIIRNINIKKEDFKPLFLGIKINNNNAPADMNNPVRLLIFNVEKRAITNKINDNRVSLFSIFEDFCAKRSGNKAIFDAK